MDSNNNNVNNNSNNHHSNKILEEKTTGVFIPPEDRPNPHHLPRSALHNGLSIYGCRVNNSGKNETPVDHVRLRNMPMRKDDVLIAAYPKSGTHWLWEVVHMLVNGTISYEKRVKEFNMLEACEIKVLEPEASPRVLNSHLWTCHLPRDLFHKRAKIIHIVRNPKDVLVSYYHHCHAMAEPGFSIGGMMKAVMDNNILHAPNQLEYLRAMAEFQRSNPDQPFKVIYYEKMKQDPATTTKELAEFLDLPHTEEFCTKVAHACSFKKMKKADTGKSRPTYYQELSGDVKIYRKGKVADWKNHLTVAQNEEFEAFIADEKAKGGLDYDFIYN